MGLFDGKKNEPKTRDPRPKGAQKGVTARAHGQGGSGSKARTPWVYSGKGSNAFNKKPRWKNK